MSSRATQTSTPSPEPSLRDLSNDAVPAALSALTDVQQLRDLTLKIRSERPRARTVTDPTTERHERENEQHSRLLAADAAWLAEVKEAHFKGPVFDSGADRLVLAAVAKIKARIRSGEMIQASAAAGRPVAAADAGLRQLRACDADLDALAWDVIDRAWRKFTTRALTEGGWDPTRGTTLTGYLQGFCTGEFKNAYMKWLPGFLQRNDVLAEPTTMSELLARDRSPTSTPQPPPFELDVDAQALLDHLDLPEQQAVVLIALGYKKNEAAAILDIGPKALSARLAKAKRLLQKHYPDWRSQ